MARTEITETKGPSNLFLALLTVGVWGVVLLVPGAMYWDDWVILGGDTMGVYRDLGIPLLGHVVLATAVVGPVGFKLVAIACTVVVALASRGIAARGLGLDPHQTFVVAALVAVLPFNVARASAAILNVYAISLALFFVAWWLLVCPRWHRHVRGGAAAVLLLLSYTTASLLLFVAVPIAHLALLELDRSRGFWRGSLQFIGRFWYVLATPMAYWNLRATFLQPSGLYAEGYNRFAEWSWPLGPAQVATALMLTALGAGVLLLLLRIFRAPSQRVDVATCLLGGFWTVGLAVLLWLGRGSTSPGAFAIPVLVALAGVTLVAVSGVAIRPGPKRADIKSAGFLVATGLVVFALGALPYLLVGKPPTFTDWETRHQLLLPVGSALLLLAATRALEGASRPSLARVTGYSAVGISAVAVQISGLTLVADWHKQEQVITALSNLEEVRAASTVVVTDETTEWSYGGRQLRFYEPIGWLHEAFGDRSRFALDSADAQTGKLVDLQDEGVRYGFPAWNPEGPAIGIVVRPRSDASRWDLLVGRQAIEVTPTSASFEPAGPTE